MNNPDTDLLFPPRVIPVLGDSRSAAWKRLVKRVLMTDEGSLDRLAFILIMARLGTCATCSADSFRAMEGCTACSKQALKRYRGSDSDLVALFEQAKSEVDVYLNKEN